MAALLVGLSVMSIMLSMALPVWSTATQREREAELVFRGEQYAQAIELFSRRNGGYPPNLQILEEGRYIRKLYKDPMTPDGEFQPVYLGQPLPGQTPEAGRGGPPASAGTLGQAGLPAGAGPIIGGGEYEHRGVAAAVQRTRALQRVGLCRYRGHRTAGGSWRCSESLRPPHRPWCRAGRARSSRRRGRVGDAASRGRAGFSRSRGARARPRAGSQRRRGAARVSVSRSLRLIS